MEWLPLSSQSLEVFDREVGHALAGGSMENFRTQSRSRGLPPPSLPPPSIPSPELGESRLPHLRPLMLQVTGPFPEG